MTQDENNEIGEKIFDGFAKAFDSVPILEQLRFAHNIVCDKGGNRANSPQEGTRKLRSFQKLLSADAVLRRCEFREGRTLSRD